MGWRKFICRARSSATTSRIRNWRRNRIKQRWRGLFHASKWIIIDSRWGAGRISIIINNASGISGPSWTTHFSNPIQPKDPHTRISKENTTTQRSYLKASSSKRKKRDKPVKTNCTMDLESFFSCIDWGDLGNPSSILFLTSKGNKRDRRRDLNWTGDDTDDERRKTEKQLRFSTSRMDGKRRE